MAWLVSVLMVLAGMVILGASFGRGRWGLAVGCGTVLPDAFRGVTGISEGFSPPWWWLSWGSGFWPPAMMVLAALYLVWGFYPLLLLWRGCQGHTLVAISLVIVLGGLTAWLMPVNPPWMMGAVRSVDIMSVTGSLVAADVSPAAAFPSVHVAVPVVVALSERSWPWAWGAVVTSVVVVLAGEHWIVDVLGGIALGVLCWLVVCNTGWQWLSILRQKLPVEVPWIRADVSSSSVSEGDISG